jgi:hypothetical protein
VTMRMIAVRMLMVVVGVVLMRPGVWMGVAQRAVTMQVAFDEFIGRGHSPSD